MELTAVSPVHILVPFTGPLRLRYTWRSGRHTHLICLIDAKGHCDILFIRCFQPPNLYVKGLMEATRGSPQATKT